MARMFINTAFADSFNNHNESQQPKRNLYGKYKGFYKWDLTKDWFSMSNDSFFEQYGFNFNPHDYKGLYADVRKFLYGS